MTGKKSLIGAGGMTANNNKRQHAAAQQAGLVMEPQVDTGFYTRIVGGREADSGRYSVNFLLDGDVS